jgi:hypothetical protein
MNEANKPADQPRYSPVWQMMLTRIRELNREPEALFWVYGFPILLIVALGIAFRTKPDDQSTVDVQRVANGRDQATLDVLEKDTRKRLKIHIEDEAECAVRLRTNKTDLVIVPEGESGYRYQFDSTRQEAIRARMTVNDLLQEKGGRKDPVPVEDDEKGCRYIDFLVPGLIGMGIMGGGMFGVGFGIVDMRIRKVLKRFLATPMRKVDFLGAIILSRLLFLIPEVLVVLLFSWLAFGVVIKGSLLTLAVLILFGALSFSGVGLLVASRARTLEAVSGLMNLTMLPMWVLSGIFFPPEKFPEVAQPFIKALPLTPLINALRAVSLEGATLAQQWPELCVMAAWGLGSFVLALWWFRWN